MRTTFFIILIIFFLMLLESCIKDFLLRLDENLPDKEEYTENQLRTDGYYYSRRDSSQYNNGVIIIFFYNNGIMLDGGIISDPELNLREEEFKNGTYYSYIKDYKSAWGIFTVKDRILTIERFYSSFPRKIGREEATILNDSTFRITTFTEVSNNISEETDELYRFKKFSQKPDSINTFIK